MSEVTREEFLQEYHSEYPSWACDAEAQHIKEPSEARIRHGWVIEQPLHSYFNWHMNRTDERLLALEARVAWLESRLAEGTQE